MTFLCSWNLSPPWSLAHISQFVPSKHPVTQNKLPSLWMGQNNTEMSLLRCNWSYLGKHKSIVSIIAMSPVPWRFFHEGPFASFHLHSDYYFHVSDFSSSLKMLHITKICILFSLESVELMHFNPKLYFIHHFHFSSQLSQEWTSDFLNTLKWRRLSFILKSFDWSTQQRYLALI